MILIITVARNTIDTAIATLLSRFLSMGMLMRPWRDESISEVIRRIMAVTASQRVMSQNGKGKFILLLT